MRRHLLAVVDNFLNLLAMDADWLGFYDRKS
jgi:hypothetical protein